MAEQEEARRLRMRQRKHPQVLFIPKKPRNKQEAALLREIKMAQMPPAQLPPSEVQETLKALEAERTAAKDAEAEAERNALRHKTPAQKEAEYAKLAWHGLTCRECDLPHAAMDVSVHLVSEVRLPRNGLGGVLPAAFGAAFDRLEALDLTRNGIGGPLPPALARCTGLREVLLGGNRFAGGVPDVWGFALHKLRVLDLAGNRRLGGDGALFLAPALRGAVALEILDVSGNSFSGPLHDALPIGHGASEAGNASAGGGVGGDHELREARQGAHVSTLPAGMRGGALVRLRELRVGGNSFCGGVPRALGRLAQLEVLDARGNTLAGSIPDELAGCVALERLILNDNQLEGEIPWAFCMFAPPRLRELFLANNRLSGALPDSIGQMQRLECLNVGRNQLSGTLPVDALCNCAALRSLCLRPNAFAASGAEMAHAQRRIRERFGDKLSFLL